MNLITSKTVGRPSVILFNLLSELGYDTISAFQKDRGLVVDGLFGKRSYDTLYHILLNVKHVYFEGYYYRVPENKRQIVWHHSAGWDNARGMFDWWKNDKVNHVATCIGINDAGEVYKGFEEEHWAHHIGAAHWNNLSLNRKSIGVEILNWGALNEKKQTWSGLQLQNDRVIELNYKGARFYEIYTDAEIKALKYWTLLNAMRFDIPLAYRHNDMWAVSNNALMGASGIYTHNSFVAQKSDVSPQPKLIEMAKSLADYEK